MRTLSVFFESKDNFWRDWIPEADMGEVKKDCDEHGITVRVEGDVSWQQQLAAMENPEP